MTNLEHVPDQRRDGRHLIGRFVAPGTEAGAMEGFMVVDLSREGMSLLRVVQRSEDGRKRGLDHRFSWLAIPLPEYGLHLCALAEVVHRKKFGPLEWLGVRFDQMSPSHVELLDSYLRERDELSFGAAKVQLAPPLRAGAGQA